jgi:hypothetical protein
MKEVLPDTFKFASTHELYSLEICGMNLAYRFYRMNL